MEETPKKKRMSAKSCKAKGRAACKEVVELLAKYWPDHRPGDFEITSSGVTGEDVKLSPAARDRFPFVIEVKNQQALNIWEALKQAQSHRKDRENLYPLLFFKRNHSKLYVALEADDFLKLVVNL